MKHQFVFTNPLSFFEIKDNGKPRFFIKGDFSSTDLDLVNDICTPNCLKSMVNQINSGRIKLDLEHEAFRGNSNEEMEINKTRIPLAKAIDAEVKGDASEATWELNMDYKKFDQNNNIVMTFQDVKSNIESGMLDAFSIAYIPTKVAHKDINGEKVRLLDDVKLLNVALTGNPVNTAAQLRSVFTKSMDAIDEYKQEKKNNPEISNLLEVKSKTSKQEVRKLRNEDEDEESDDEEEKECGKKPKKKCSSPNGDYIDRKEDKKMSEENSEKDAPIEETVEETKEEVKSESEEESDEESVEESKPSENSETESDLKALINKIESLEKEIKDLKETKDLEVKSKEIKAIKKAVQENVDVNNVKSEIKAIGGLSELK